MPIMDTQTATQQFEDALSRGLPALHRRAFSILGNTPDAEDAVQDALLSACKHLDQFRGKSQMSTWLNAIVANCALMQLRRRARYIHLSMDFVGAEGQEFSLSERLSDRGPTPEEECRNGELDSQLKTLVRQLPPTLRRTFYLRHVHDLSLGETAQFLGAPIGTVKAQLFRARASLKKSMRRTPQARHRPTCKIVRQA